MFFLLIMLFEQQLLTLFAATQLMEKAVCAGFASFSCSAMPRLPRLALAWRHLRLI